MLALAAETSHLQSHITLVVLHTQSALYSIIYQPCSGTTTLLAYSDGSFFKPHLGLHSNDGPVLLTSWP